MKKRMVFRIRWIKKVKHWKLLDNRGAMVDFGAEFLRKIDLVKSSREYCKGLWKEDGQLTQLVIHNKDGKIQRGNGEATYGNDPQRSKG